MLREKQQPDAADWFEKWWTGARGRWTSGHAGHANVRTNSSVEGFIGACKNAWLGTGFRNCSMNTAEFFGAVLEDVKQRIIEHHNRLLSTPTGMASFQKFSIVDTDVINALKTLHPFCLWLTKPFFGQKEFREGMNRVYAVDKDGNPAKYTSIVGRVMDMCKKHQKVFPVDFVSTHVALHHTFTFPSERAFKRIDKNRSRHFAELEKEFEEKRHDHLMMQLPGAMRSPTHGEKSAYYFSRNLTNFFRKTYHLRPNIRKFSESFCFRMIFPNAIFPNVAPSFKNYGL